MFVGPPTQGEITDILMSFRFHKVAIIGDIEHQKQFHRILWREYSNLPLKSYEMNVLTFGTSCASFLATSVLKHIAQNDPNDLITKKH
jgi:hypothetical protein